METSRPEKVDMNAAKAPAQVMPERTEPRSGWSRPASSVGSSSTTLSVPLEPMAS